MSNEVHLIIGEFYPQSIWRFTEEPNSEKHYIFYGCRFRSLTLIRKLWFKFNFPGQRWWYKKELLKIEGRCIILDADVPYQFLEWFAKTSKSKQPIFYYWNTYNASRILPDDIKRLGYAVWSVDLEDCQKFAMKYNPQFYCKSWYANLNSIKNEYDIAFVGRDKNGRMKQVKKLSERFGKDKYRWYFYFIAHHWYNVLKSSKYRHFLNYRDMLNEEMKATAILDYVQSGQSGMTLRVFDALCNQKKLITNMKSIKREKFYNKNNIFVIDVDNDSSFEDFMQAEYQNIPKDILEERSFSGWITRFFENE